MTLRSWKNVLKREWTRRDLNPWPSRCKRDDLPLIYEPAHADCGILFLSGFHIVVTDQVAARKMRGEDEYFLNNYAKADHRTEEGKGRTDRIYRELSRSKER